jgi:hypothetical protein
MIVMCMKKGGYMCMYDRQLPFNILIIIAMQQSHIACFSIPLLLCLLSLCCVNLIITYSIYIDRGRRGHDRMVVGITTTYAISAYHHLCSCWEFESRSRRVVQHYVIKFVSDLRH